MGEMKRITVSAAGQEFHLKSDQEEAYVVELAASVDKRIAEMRAANPALTPLKAAVILSMELLDDYQQLEADYNTFRSEMDNLKF